MALDGIVMSRRMPDGRRFVTSLTGVSRAPTGGVQLTEYVAFDARKMSWRMVREPPFVGRAVAAGVIDEKEVARWRSSCACA